MLFVEGDRNDYPSATSTPPDGCRARWKEDVIKKILDASVQKRICIWMQICNGVFFRVRGIDTCHVVILLVEAIDIFLVATVMLIFDKKYTGSNLFGLFRLKRRPLWLEIRSLPQLKTKVGHVIVMILLVGMFEKSNVVPISTGFDLLCFSASIFTSYGCLYLLSKLHMN
ncbi:hypothetical protein L7F22_011576 [Adiantum nelumboides]|nr:hypothetical protein [Adiantum nelumboides]